VRTPRRTATGRAAKSEAREQDGGTRNAVRQIVRRYRETFERLGR
jgi:hypothetical protein